MSFQKHFMHQVFSNHSSANATPEFEGRGGEDLANEICRFLQMSYMSGDTINLAELSVLAGQQCWVLYVDILVTVFVCLCLPGSLTIFL